MADYLPTLQDALYTIIGATWPEIVLPGTGQAPTCFTTVQALTISVIEFAKDGIAGNGRPAPPYCFIDLGRSKPEPGLCPTVDVQRVPLAIHYLDMPFDDHDTDQIVVNAKLFALKKAIDAGTTLFNTDTNGEIDTSPFSPLVKALSADSKAQITGGFVSWPGLLVSYDY